MGEDLSTRVLVVDDDAEFRAGLGALLADASFVEVIGLAADGREAVMMAKQGCPDIVLMDINMPEVDGITATKFLTEFLPSARVIALSVHTDSALVRQMFDAGASGYVAKSRARADVVSAVQAVAADQLFMSPNIDSAVLREIG